MAVAVKVSFPLLLDLQHRANPPSAGTVASRTIAATVASLKIPARTVELPTEKARRLREAIKVGDYAAADKIYADVLAGSRIESWRFYPFTDFIGGIADLDDPVFETDLGNWIHSRPSDAAPLVTRARYYLDLAWARRGHAFSNETPAAKLETFTTYIGKALADSEAALRLDTSNPYAFSLRLSIMRSIGASRELMDAFGEAVDKYPAYYPLYTITLEALQPKWGGSVPAMYAFVDRYAGSLNEDSPRKLLYLALYGRILESVTAACNSIGSTADENAVDCVSPAMAAAVTPQLERGIQLAFRLYERSDKYEFGVALADILSPMLNVTNGAFQAGAMLEMAATTLHSNTQLRPDQPPRNNYVIDRLVAQSWYMKGNYQNAIQKGREALSDIAIARFPSEEERDVAAADALALVAAAHSQLGDGANTIAYRQAAISLGDKTELEQPVCYNYYYLKAYDDAIRSCTKAIDEGAGGMAARYWRGAAYRDQGDPEAAVKDWAIVAGSESDYRATAAIDTSMIYFGRNDNRTALDVLNRYDYLYDPERTEKSNVAVGYNNRCYAYMQLGELRKALDDCTASLKYGAIPDAYSKQLQLIQMLKTPAPVL
ncbi:MAG TPA: hypothetical protein VHA70_04940 [Bauldia sp.]|nr:hypothetical protein [Bauldia sp.]